MGNYWLDFDKQEKGYKRTVVSKENFKSLIGKQIVYLHRRDIDRNRGYAFPKFNTITNVIRGRVIFGNNDHEERILEIVEAGVKID